MSHQPQFIFDPFEFARRSNALDGELDARDLPRVAEAIRGTQAWRRGTAQPVRYELTGRQIDDKSFLDVVAAAELVFCCRRCLEDVVCAVEVNARLLLVPKGEELPDEALEVDEFDPIHAERDFDVIGAVEEELLLALPLAPTHEDCSVPAVQENGDDRSPFALLKGLKTTS
jgi:uncharacterized protein